MSEETPLLDAHPSWWHYFWHLCFFWLLFIPLLVAWWKRSSFRMAVYEDRVHVRRGIFRRELKDVFISDIRGVEVAQGFFQRLTGIGDIRIDTAASDDEIVARGLPGAVAIKDLILGRRRALGAGRA